MARKYKKRKYNGKRPRFGKRGGGRGRSLRRTFRKYAKKNRKSVLFVGRKHLSPDKAFVQMKTTITNEISNTSPNYVCDFVVKGNNLHVPFNADNYHSGKLFWLAQLYNNYYIYKTKIKAEWVDRAIQGSTPNFKGIYIHPTTQGAGALYDITYLNWNQALPDSTPEELDRVRYKHYNDQNTSGKPIVLKHSMRTNKVFGKKGSEYIDSCSGTIVARDTATTVTPAITYGDPTKQYWWHIFVANLQETGNTATLDGRLVLTIEYDVYFYNKIVYMPKVAATNTEDE